MKEHINLFQPDLLEGAVKARAPRRQQWIGASIGMFLVFLIVFYIQDEKKQILLKREVDAILQQRQQLQQQMAALTSATLPGEEVGRFLTGEALLKERVMWSRILVEVSRVVPEGVWITGLENNPAQGVRFDGFAVSYQKLTELMSSLEASPLFQDVLLDFSRQNTERKVDFSIHTRLKQAGPDTQLEKR
jgi:Tfp pilus assembly protein PilN